MADHAARTHRYRVTACHIDALNGGSFTLETDGLDSVNIKVSACAAQYFLPLRKGGHRAGDPCPACGLEEFWQLYRASDATPHNAIGLSHDYMQLIGRPTSKSEQQ